VLTPQLGLDTTVASRRFTLNCSQRRSSLNHDHAIALQQTRTISVQLPDDIYALASLDSCKLLHEADEMNAGAVLLEPTCAANQTPLLTFREETSVFAITEDELVSWHCLSLLRQPAYWRIRS